MVPNSSTPSLRLSDPVQFVKGIGPVRAQALEEVGVKTVEDLLYYFPRRYLDRRNVTPISGLRIGEAATVLARVVGQGIRYTRRRKFLQVTLTDESGTLACVWFHGIEWIQKRFHVGDRVAVHGKVEFYKHLQMVHPDFDLLELDEDPLNTGKIVPLYPGTAGLKAKGLDSRRFRRVVQACWDRLSSVSDHFSSDFRSQYGLPDLSETLKQIHAPDSEEWTDRARHRLKYDEHFFLQLLMALRRKALDDYPGRKFPELGPIVSEIYRSLPFQLTDAQVRVMRELRADFQSGRMMNRLLQGDVGSGKTVIALLAAAIVAGAEAQVAVMAPTEILAEQHYRAFRELTKDVDLPLELLTGSTPKTERAEILDALASRRVLLLVGTHALIQEDVAFGDLALIIVDEQHRFGVMQRGRLMEKGVYPHLLAMTATPIPRTLAITYHGDMDTSVLDEMPKNRGKVTTRVVEPDEIDIVYQLVRQEVDQGRQCFVIFPLISESETGDLKAAKEGFHHLRDEIFPSLEVGYIHGRMKGTEKEAVMEAFQAGKTHVLVSTTVVEVGIDVANATIMVVENAERFGLTQLHQLRGRIGRSLLGGHCLLIKRGGGDEAARRLAIMENISNGFEIADEDLKLRGPGELFGVRQHGFEKMRLANLVSDGTIIRAARKAAFSIINQDPNLSRREHQPIKQVLMQKYRHQLDFVTIS
ncbi:MAG: ATP-dependent DNA helicase RecG [Fidelibacterota bacterium]|nr:MAG: ATP-dependent DNA helicase RecG [Candidatus Neomarinimicrobiota bacterium]